jgi:hypothetical protein
MARKTITRWKQLGFFREVDGQLELHTDIAAVELNDLDGLRAAIVRLVLAPENNPVLTDSADDNENSKASDYAYAAAWALMQDPYSFPAKYRGGVETLQASQGVDPPPFSNDTRWAGFAEWAVFLGVGWSAPKIGLVLNPAFAVRVALTYVFADASELAQDFFLTRLADAVPIIDGGRYQLAVKSQTARPWQVERTNHISPCLSAAMMTLEAQGDLRLEFRSDAPQRMLLGRGGRDLRPVSHIIRLEGS